MFHNQVWLSRMDGHMGLANSLALEIAGVTKNIEDPIGGTVVRNTGGGNKSYQLNFEITNSQFYQFFY